MSARLSSFRSVALVGACLAAAACSRDIGSLDPAPFPTDPGVLVDGFPAGIRWEPFAGSSLEAISVDNTVKYRGSSSLKVTVPGPGSYAGGAFVSNVPRDLREYDAITFWARSSRAGATLNTAGTANDNTGTSRFTAERSAIPLSTSWRKITIPIPLSSKLSQEAGMFFFAEGPENDAGYEFWIDELQFETLGTIRNPRPVINSATVTGEVGGSVSVTGTAVTFDVDGQDVTVAAAPAYFTFSSSNPSVATIADDGSVTVVGAGTATVSAALGATAATGTVEVVATAPPSVGPDAPTRDAADVISLFSNSYTNRPVDTWSASFDNSDVADVQLGGNDVKKYTNMGFVGIEFIAQQVDARDMTHLHVDIYTADPSRFLLRLVDFGANGAFGGNDDSNGQVILNAGTSPAVSGGVWSSLDIPLSAFGGLQARQHLAQIILENASSTLYLDNVYFYKVPAPPVPTAPTTAAPTPTRPAGSVISLFSNAYPNVPVSTWSAPWDNADVADEQIAGNDVKKYTNFVFTGIEFTSPTVDASAMEGFHLDIWTPDPTAPPAVFKIKLVDFGADGAFAGGDDVEHEITLDANSTPAIRTGEWTSLEIPFSAFTGLTTRGHLAQLIMVSDPNTVFIDNVYFYTNVVPTAPLTAAPAPTFAATDVISLFSDTYTNVPVGTWSAPWDNADVEDVQIGGNNVKKYSNFVFAGIEFTSPTVDATAMTHFSVDIWTPDPTAAPAVFKIKLVDFGADGGFGGGDDKEHEITLTSETTPAIATGGWVRLDIPLTAFTGLTTRGHLAQLIMVSDPNTVFVDNVLLHK
jgi:hypothetical protein